MFCSFFSYLSNSDFIYKTFLTFSFFYAFYKYKKLTSKKCCGIIGYLGNVPNAVQICIEGIQILQFRGYDSCGLCTYNEKTKDFQLTKFASDISHSFQNNEENKNPKIIDNADCIQKIVKEAPLTHLPSKIGIGHTRWATHGRKIPLNAHPHVDFSNKIALCHNGIIDNYRECVKFLESNGIKCITDTDTEVVVQIIGYYYSKKGLSFKEAVTKTLNEHIQGSYAFAIMCKDDPDKLIVARNGSPLLVGIGKDFFIVSSEVSAFQKYTNNYFVIDSSKIIELSLNMKINTELIKTCSTEEVLLKPKEGYDYFILQEIYEQPQTLKRAINYGSRLISLSNNLSMVKLGGLEEYSNFLKNGKNLIILACGTSMHASMFVGHLMRKLDIFNTVQIIDGANFTEDNIPKDNPIAVFVSQSGETYDILKPLEICKNKGLICIGIVNKRESTLARSVLCGVFINAGREISVASTKAFSGQVISLLLMTLFFSQIKHETSFLNPIFVKTVNFIQNSSELVEKLLPKCEEKAKEAAKVLIKYNSIFCLGKGFGESIAKEIALKIKEVSYLHCEVYNAGEFKHGPIALIDSKNRTPIIILVNNDEFFDDLVTSLNQIRSRNSTIILLTNCLSKFDSNKVDFIFEYPDEGILSSLFGVYIGQLIAYYCAIELNYNPDKPKQLAKEITTK
jgi:glucosamine--fructose-6-phosphate aminotransferase (isomerizing)